MNQFKDFNITIENKAFTGEKIKLDRILNKQITVTDFKIEQSKYTDKGNGKRLVLEIKVDDVQRIVFTGSTVLMEMIQKVPRGQLPFQTTIIKDNERYQFT